MTATILGRLRDWALDTFTCDPRPRPPTPWPMPPGGAGFLHFNGVSVGADHAPRRTPGIGCRPHLTVRLPTLLRRARGHALNCFTEVPEMALCSNESEHAMATDYDAPRKQEEESPADSLEALQASRGGNAQTAVIDLDENDTAEGIDLPGADLSNEELPRSLWFLSSPTNSRAPRASWSATGPRWPAKGRPQVLPRLRRLTAS